MPIASREEMKAANGDGFDAADYVHYALDAAGLGEDFVLALTDLLNPTFVERDGRLLVESVGAPQRYAAYRQQGMSAVEAEYWANLTLVSELLADLDVPQAKSLAQVFLWSWQNALTAQYPSATQLARILEDKQEGEVFVTVAEPTAGLSR